MPGYVVWEYGAVNNPVHGRDQEERLCEHQIQVWQEDEGCFRQEKQHVSKYSGHGFTGQEVKGNLGI